MAKDLRLTVLGSATPYPSVDNPCSGYLVSGGGTRVWMDAGSGTLGPLQRHARLDELDAIWISHLHADHSADLLTAYYGALYADVRLTAPIPLYGPPGTADRLPHQHIGPQPDRIRLRRRRVVRRPPGGRRLAPADQSAEGRDALLCEAGIAQAPSDGDQVTHVGRSLTPWQAVARASARFDGPVDHAAPGAAFRIAPAAGAPERSRSRPRPTRAPALHERQPGWERCTANPEGPARGLRAD